MCPAPTGAEGPNAHDQFLIARQITQWHYQWLLVNEHLPQIAGQAMVSNVLSHGNEFCNPPAGDAFMPIEFGAACYRFGLPPLAPGDLGGIGDVYRPFAPFPGTGLQFGPSLNPDIPGKRVLHQGALPLLRPGGDTRELPLTAGPARG